MRKSEGQVERCAARAFRLRRILGPLGPECGGFERMRNEGNMKVSASVKRRCDKCRIIRRRGVIMVICTDPRHKQKQG